MTEQNGRARAARTIDVLAALGALVGAILTARMDAGLAGPWVLIGLASVVPLYLVARGWRLPWWTHAVAAALPATIVIVGLSHGYGEGMARASRFAYAAFLVLSVAAWARTPARRLAAGAGLAILVADGYLTGWWIWWGQGDASFLMRGNFYWHNQFGIYMVIGIAMAAVLAVAGGRVFALLGFVVTFLAGAGAIWSGSRAAVSLLAAVIVVAAAIALAARGWRGLIRVALLPAGIALSALFFASSVFFPGGSDGGDGGGAQVDRLTNGESAESSVSARLVFWLDALRLGASSPLIGVGLQAFGPRLQCLGRSGGAYSSHPHNEYLLAWAETGALGALPLLAALLGAVVLVIRSFRRPADGVAIPRRISWLPSGAELLADPARWGALLALVVALGHAAFDFDWAYPALLAVAGLAGGIAAAPVLAMRATTRTRLLVNLVLVGVLIAAAVAGFMLDPLPAESLRPIPLSEVVCPAG
ncbi:O-antigen ligase family protein [Protaetiibacter larvae]|uniref:O-antigen ligase family protein n=1 Tax=Protaetiibacter larvae TaxID=2592654 RepID=A0A5C1Y618_9MICO|nr:O-antigen ligase family protein [Protaetiibacter larvae]QEO09231.1 O-antigen ligase family protein [Protaetiibacter larvae]